MNKYKISLLALRFLLLVGGLLTIWLIVFPIYQYQVKVNMDTKFSFLVKNMDAYQWLIQHEKMVSLEEQQADIIYIDDETQINLDLYPQIEHNTLIVEQVFSKLNDQREPLRILSGLTGVQYSGFMGKTFLDLSDTKEVPEKLINQYEAKTQEKWNFWGEGIVIWNTESVIVLKKGKDYRGKLMLESEGKSVPFLGYFEITSGNGLTKPIAQFNLKLTSKGEQSLAAYDLSGSFPAAYQMESPLYQAVYFAGDYSAYQTTIPVQHELLPWLMKHKVLYQQQNSEQAYWQWFYPTLTGIIKDSKDGYVQSVEPMNQQDHFFVSNQRIYQNNGATSEPFFAKGVNLGAALPGKSFTEFPEDAETYLGWLNAMATLNINTIRVYTLLPPTFYEALYIFNAGREYPIYLLQEIWPEENPKDLDYLEQTYDETFEKEIEITVDVIHGNANVLERKYRSFGLYRFDVSPYLLGYLVGREMEPEEVKATNALHQGYQYQGDYIYSEENASPTEAWLASACDYTLQVENTYGKAPLIGIVSWPTLDTIQHDSEWNATGDKALQHNDATELDINHIGIHTDKVSGFFGAYHIYPNYPDFMNNDEKYNAYQDDQGRFRYGGYLQEFMETQTKYPALVAEYGISTSQVTAHISPDGYNHGGLDEESQASGIIRMTDAIVREGYSGAIIFEWMDEWAKKTWTTEPYMIPYDRHALWHNKLDPEQNYGLIEYQSITETIEAVDLDDVSKQKLGVVAIQTSQDEGFIDIAIEFKNNNFIDEGFLLAISTHSEKSVNEYNEFILEYDQSPRLLVNPGYNWLKGKYKAGDYADSAFEELIQLTNIENTTKNGSVTASKFENLSALSIGSFDNAQNNIEVEGDKIRIRLPYGLLGISDPSSHTILSDENSFVPTQRDAIHTTINPTIDYTLSYQGEKLAFGQVLKPWEVVAYDWRAKAGFQQIADYFKGIQ